MKKTSTTDVAAPKKTRAPRVKKARTEKGAEEAPVRAISRFAAQTLLSPLVTEKTTKLSSENVVVFRIAAAATRVAVKQAVKELYGVLPIKVNVINVHSRAVRFGRTMGISRGYKKALVTLPKGTKIDVFASV